MLSAKRDRKVFDGTMKQSRITAAISVVKYDQGDALAQKIEQEKEFTIVTDADPKSVTPRALCAVSIASRDLDNLQAEVVTHIGVVKKGARVATNQVRLKVTDLVRIPNVPLNELINLIPAINHKHLYPAFTGQYHRIPPKAGEQLLKAILEFCSQEAAELTRLVAKFDGYRQLERNRARDEDAAIEKDALGVALDIFGLDRSRIFRRWESERASVGTSFLSGLTEYSAYEDDVLARDLRSIPGWQIVSEHISGVVEFENRDEERLVVINANRKPLEKATGVDLIYFHRKYEAFTLVQYKMMDQKSSDRSEQYYSPRNASHDEELARMEKLHGLISESPPSNTLSDFRLISCPIFFKVCRKLELKSSDTSIAPGAYLPLTQWKLLLNDPSTSGPKGGTQIGFHTLRKRYIGTQTFVDLVQRGFTGTEKLSSTRIAAFIEEAIEKGYSVVYAIDEKLSDSSRPATS